MQITRLNGSCTWNVVQNLPIWNVTYLRQEPGLIAPNGDALMLLACVLQEPSVDPTQLAVWSGNPLMRSQLEVIHPSFVAACDGIRQGQARPAIAIWQPNNWYATMLNEHGMLRQEDVGQLPYSPTYLAGRAKVRARDTILALAESVHVILLAEDHQLPDILSEIVTLNVSYTPQSLLIDGIPATLADLHQLWGIPRVKDAEEIPASAVEPQKVEAPRVPVASSGKMKLLTMPTRAKETK